MTSASVPHVPSLGALSSGAPRSAVIPQGGNAVADSVTLSRAEYDQLMASKILWDNSQNASFSQSRAPVPDLPRSWTPRVTLKKFSGDDENYSATEFIADRHLVMTSLSMPSDIFLKSWVPLHLVGQARRWWIRSGVSLDWLHFEMELKRQFRCEGLQEKLVDQIFARKHRFSEPVEAYCNELIELNWKLLDPFEPRDLFRIAFSNLAPGLKAMLTQQKFSSVAALRDAASRTQRHMMAAQQADRTGARQTFSSLTPRVGVPQSTNVSGGSLVSNTAPAVSQDVRVQGVGALSQPSVGRQNSNACYRCGLVGHFARECTYNRAPDVGVGTATNVESEN